MRGTSGPGYKKVRDGSIRSRLFYPLVRREIDLIRGLIVEHGPGERFDAFGLGIVTIGYRVVVRRILLPGTGKRGAKRFSGERMVFVEGIALGISLPVRPHPGSRHPVGPLVETS